ncbi:uncharacterized protein Z518_08968 [Rhinocladiella mackenziei CBS 650.93]|uniref:Malate synthase C-terminal domain-containing protein n=1 Tax=Rhinocladiella mackenziei CBS 650.93 TaxID=1442369 RepID=A0A0D2GSC4_9EURO|nr:uncharacterized protein Z518_08968 [Rhinocladiella mackenziei CBS 650.93]KIX01243.1 hypothetical protein Z518_08968 [Rhinocladiella mackenziei CBS 650.93]
MPGTITEGCIRKILGIGLGYMEGWLRGIGSVLVNHLRESAATAKVSRSQLWVVGQARLSRLLKVEL